MRRISYRNSLAIRADSADTTADDENVPTDPATEDTGTDENPVNSSATEFQDELGDAQAKEEAEAAGAAAETGGSPSSGAYLFIVIMIIVLVFGLAYGQWWLVKMLLESLGVPNSGAWSFALLFVIPGYIGMLKKS